MAHAITMKHKLTEVVEKDVFCGQAKATSLCRKNLSGD